MPVVTGLFTYPVKSCRGISLEAADLDVRGFRHDRRWMVVDAAGQFVSQRAHPALARIVPRLTSDGLELAVDGGSERLSVPASRWGEGPSVSVTVWKYGGTAIDQGDEAATFFSAFLGTPVRFVRMPEAEVRVPNRLPDGVRAQVGFADGYPLLLASEASLAELNRHLPEGEAPIPMDRFRPNVVVAGCAGPWEEERWNRFVIGGVPFHGVKPCERCAIPRVDQRTGVPAGKEPSRTLARIHRDGKAALFGANLVHGGLGTIRVGQRVREIIFGPRPAV